MITAKILAHSVNPRGTELISMLLTYPRFIHSEFMTHRCFSRNAASSRAIPFAKMVEAIATNPAWPERWPTEKKGMQGGDELEGDGRSGSKIEWRSALAFSIGSAKMASKWGLHKSLCNRLLEPWAHITVLVTGTREGYSNFFALRAHPAAMPEFQMLAYRMLDVLLNNKPIILSWGD